MVSVIIPVYNGEKYIGKCLESLSSQSFTDFEVILVDNNSTDGSEEVIDCFIKKGERSHRIQYVREARQGIAYARNTGTQLAKGDYICFIDQDDYVEHDYIERLIQHTEKGDMDIVVSGYSIISYRPNGRVKKKTTKLCGNEWSKYRVIAPWGKAFRRVFLVENQLRFLPVVKGEDVFFVLNAYNQSMRVKVIDYVGYNWVNNQDSLSRTVHKKIAEENGLFPVLDEITKSLLPLQYIKHTELEYFIIKTIAYDVLRCTKDNDYTAVKGYLDELCQWMSEHFPNSERNDYLRFGKPKEEPFFLAETVRLFWKMRNTRMMGWLLKDLSLFW